MAGNKITSHVFSNAVTNRNVLHETCDILAVGRSFEWSEQPAAAALMGIY